MEKCIGKKKSILLVLIALLTCFSIKTYGFSDGLGMGKVAKMIGKVTVSSEDLTPDSIIYGGMFEMINVGDKSSLEIILPPQFKYANDCSGIIELKSNTQIIHNIYTTDSEDKEWWKGQTSEEVIDKTIIYIIDLNKGKVNIKMSYDCMKYIDIFQFLCGDYDASKNPSGGLIIDPSDSKDVELSIEAQEKRIIVTVTAGKVRVFNRKDIDEKISAGQTVEF